jgi:AraC family transcriptional activator of mtrCDE
MDSLSHLLALLAPRCEVNLHCRFGGRWQAGHQQMRSGVVPWHVVLRGEGRLNVGGQTHHLRAGDVVLLPHGSPHLMESLVEWGQVLPVAHRFNGTVTEMRAGPAEEALEMLCGEFYFGPHVSWLFSEASTLIHLHTDAREDCPELERCLTYWCARAWRSVPAAALSCAASAIRCWCCCCACCLASNSRPAGCCV